MQLAPGARPTIERGRDDERVGVGRFDVRDGAGGSNAERSGDGKETVQAKKPASGKCPPSAPAMHAWIREGGSSGPPRRTSEDDDDGDDEEQRTSADDTPVKQTHEEQGISPLNGKGEEDKSNEGRGGGEKEKDEAAAGGGDGEEGLLLLLLRLSRAAEENNRMVSELASAREENLRLRVMLEGARRGGGPKEEERGKDGTVRAAPTSPARVDMFDDWAGDRVASEGGRGGGWTKDWTDDEDARSFVEFLEYCRS